MCYRDEVISYLQANKILALKLDHALTGVGKAVSNQIETIGAGATRALYYTSCFTDEYQDVCKKQKTEDIRFRDGVIYLLRHNNVAYDMFKIYFEEIFKDKTTEQLERIKQMLMAVNIHIAASSLTNVGFALATASFVAAGMNLNLEISALAGRRAGQVVGIIGIYGIVQKAADSAHRLHITYPAYYSALYVQELEMMYFLIEPVFERAKALTAQWASDDEIADIITRMVR
ncbi:MULTISPECIES: hypothetical protein [Enterobacter]|uniref:hypothetical protein n=1 Tax=Enterobacter TaxID=547 RepID=UPI00048713B0|nr:MULTISPECIES: hypothetical protein [Enterobacter cloacae complex]HDT2077766.1 hypothetical protein [Enterobacter roggenkampii]HEG2001978.1 hypothetical protein [Enterobacter asburiae]MCD2459364.1 hypothetical protein [Enterobacter cloacae complex sp. 2021EL-01261]MDT9873281.1 hypothetical protein [Enterobacter cloacae]HDT2093782.1 hypothetical protein [Enterobacter roggenkampii]